MKYLRDLVITATAILLNAHPALSKESYLVDITECVAETAKNNFTVCIPDLEGFIKKFDGNISAYYKDKKVDAWEMLKYFLDVNPQGNVSEETRRETFLEKVNYNFLVPYDINQNDIICREDDLNQDNRITIEDWKIYQSLHPPGRYRHLKRRFHKYVIPAGPIVAGR